MSQVYRVSSVRVWRLPLPVKQWVVFALGEAPAIGWKHPHLRRLEDPGNTAVFSFEADAPSQPGSDVLVPIAAVTVFRPAPNTDRIEVRAASNCIGVQPDILMPAANGDPEHDFLPYDADTPADLFDEATDLEPADDATPSRILARSAAPVCDDKKLVEIPTRIEFKAKGWKLYKRYRYNVTSLHYCYPTDLGEEALAVLRHCLPMAIAAGVAAFPAGPAAAVAAFTAALKGCASAEIAGRLDVKIRNYERIGQWSRI